MGSTPACQEDPLRDRAALLQCADNEAELLLLEECTHFRVVRGRPHVAGGQPCGGGRAKRARVRAVSLVIAAPRMW